MVTLPAWLFWAEQGIIVLFATLGYINLALWWQQRRKEGK